MLEALTFIGWGVGAFIIFYISAGVIVLALGVWAFLKFMKE